MNDVESRRMRLLMDAFAIRLEASRARLAGLHHIDIEQAETLEIMAKALEAEERERRPPVSDERT